MMEFFCNVHTQLRLAEVFQLKQQSVCTVQMKERLFLEMDNFQLPNNMLLLMY